MPFNRLSGELFEEEVVDLSKVGFVDNCYFRGCKIIIHDKNHLTGIHNESFKNVVFDNCIIEPETIPASFLSRDNPTLFINTKVDLTSRDLKTSFFRIFSFPEIYDEWKYYMNEFWSSCTVNGEPVKNFEFDKSKDYTYYEHLGEKLPNYYSARNKKYHIELSKLNSIEETTGIDMGFQRGLLDARYERTVVFQPKDSEKYSSYHAGLEYAYIKMQKNFYDLQDSKKK